MLEVSKEDVVERLKMDNPWWQQPDPTKLIYSDFPLRDYFEEFYALVTKKEVKRAVIMMGPRRVGKTVILYQTIYRLLRKGISPKKIFFVSVDTPVYINLSLMQLLNLFRQQNGLEEDGEYYVFFDEIQYLKDWEVHLKDLTDRYQQIKFVASGSAAAALRRKSVESGAGRFTDFVLPPLMFSEYLHLIHVEDQLIRHEEGNALRFSAKNIEELNRYFVDYINFGGYPEVALSTEIRSDLERYVREDIIGKVLLRDLPSIYGISDIQELNRLFMVLAYNTGNEVELDSLAQNSGVSKPTLSRYLEYLEAAFLIMRVKRIDDTGSHFQKQRHFKVYLINPCMRAALFTPLNRENPESKTMGKLAETAIFSQWFHSKKIESVHYAAWRKSEVDLVGLDKSLLKPVWACEIKWSNRYFERPDELQSLINFSKKNNIKEVYTTTKTKIGITSTRKDVEIKQIPCSLHCYELSKRFKVN